MKYFQNFRFLIGRVLPSVCDTKQNYRRFPIIIITGVPIVSTFFLCKRKYFSGFRRHEILSVNSEVHKHQRIISHEELKKHTSKSAGIWVSFRGNVYDVTDFVDSHPGGDKILLAAGADLAPYWALYAFHLEDRVVDMLKEYYIGELEQTSATVTNSEIGPFSSDPVRHPALIPLSKTPFNAECPSQLIVHNPITPTELFFVRNHLPVPDIDIKQYKLELSTSVSHTKGNPGSISFKLDDLKIAYTPRTIAATVVCAGNRRTSMIQADRKRQEVHGEKPLIRGLDWKECAISTAEWTGVPLADVLAKYLLPKDKSAKYEDLLAAAKRAGIKYVQFEGADADITGESYGSSIPIEWALDATKDILLAFEMNGKTLTRDHGFPMRVVIPGCIGARQVKWLKRIVLSDVESSSFWQQQDYKIVQPSADGTLPDQHKLPAIFDYPVQSVICEPLDGTTLLNEGSVTVKGYAFSGGGRGILSVRVSVDGGKSWHEADLHPVSPPTTVIESDEGLELEHRSTRQWAWTLWEAEIPVSEDASEIELVCMARDSSNNVQPESCTASINVRGLLTNEWHRVNIQLTQHHV